MWIYNFGFGATQYRETRRMRHYNVFLFLFVYFQVFVQGFKANAIFFFQVIVDFWLSNRIELNYVQSNLNTDCHRTSASMRTGNLGWRSIRKSTDDSSNLIQTKTELLQSKNVFYTIPNNNLNVLCLHQFIYFITYIHLLEVCFIQFAVL